jgi:hypothetical protein
MHFENQMKVYFSKIKFIKVYPYGVIDRLCGLKYPLDYFRAVSNPAMGIHI